MVNSALLNKLEYINFYEGVFMVEDIYFTLLITHSLSYVFNDSFLKRLTFSSVIDLFWLLKPKNYQANKFILVLNSLRIIVALYVRIT